MIAFDIGSPEGWPGLSKLIEEGGEAVEVLAELALARAIGRMQRIAGKIIQTLDGKHWDGDLEPLLIDEMGDVLAAIEFLASRRGCWEPTRRRALEKFALFEEWEQSGDTKPA